MKRAIAVALALLCAGCGGGSDTPRAAEGERAPGFSTRDLDDKPVALRDYRGQTVVLNFWASYCLPCRKEFPLLAEVEALPDVVVLGVIYNDSAANARKFIADHGGTWPGLVDDGQIARAYRIGPGIPATIVIDPKGVVVKRRLGEIRSVRDVVE
ncbi:MAG: cytochrome c biosis protein CcmG, thiol:disulfide interchange protein DsbE [Actinomycetota bacterium]